MPFVATASAAAAATAAAAAASAATAAAAAAAAAAATAFAPTRARVLLACTTCNPKSLEPVILHWHNAPGAWIFMEVSH